MSFALVRLHLFDRRLNHLPFSKKMLVVELNNKWIVVTRTFLGVTHRKLSCRHLKKYRQTKDCQCLALKNLGLL